MRNGLTLIELIFTMVIVAITFIVVPKLVHTMATASKTVMKEDAIYNTMTMMGLITHLPWDNNNVQNNSILNVTNGALSYTCNQTTGYRPGGFVGGRNCINSGSIPAATNIPTSSTIYNSIEDYNGYSLNTKTECNNNLYDIGVEVSYLGAQTSDVKHVKITTAYNSSFKLKNQGCDIFDYFSYNIGQININKRRWR